ncbi:hypothetical protein [Bradyrhizobium sp. ARR65]|uniref:hypothetical protein n=1 Tax=Bradyrhizobium sp. ARR65 TaxID=1040989 RepID=UPI0004666D43|nr:hypothetical protein [Bradyrhizobium sp. ARR65]
MATLGSMAAWCTHRAGQNGASAEIHFNYWRVAQKRGIFRSADPPRDFAEIGALISHPEKIETIRIFLPFSLGDGDLHDCGPHFKRVEIAQGIFNEPLTCNVVGPPGPAHVELLKGGERFCRVHLFPAQNNIIDSNQLTRKAENGGTLITVTREALDEICHQLPENCPAYIRLRAFVPEGESSPFVEVTSPKDRFFQSGFDEIECVDFRLNEARTLPQRIESLMRTPPQEHAVALTRVAFLTAIPVAAELTGTSIAAHKNRVLERQIWNDYVGRKLPVGMMVYHWRNERNPVLDFSAFVKLRIRRSNFRIVLTYLVIAFVFGVLGNLAASGIENWFGSSSSAASDKGTTK